MMDIVFRFQIITTLLVGLIHVTNVSGNELYFIDAHSQVDHNVVPLNKVISLMENAGVRQTILSARGNLKGAHLVKVI